MKIQDVLSLPDLAVVTGFTGIVRDLLAERTDALAALKSPQGSSQFDLADEEGQALAARLRTVAKVRSHNNLISVDVVQLDGAPIALVNELNRTGCGRTFRYVLDEAALNTLACAVLALRKAPVMRRMPVVGAGDDADALLLSELGAEYVIAPTPVSNLQRKEVAHRVTLEYRRKDSINRHAARDTLMSALVAYTDGTAAIENVISGTSASFDLPAKSFERFDTVEAARAAFAAAIDAALPDAVYDVTVRAGDVQHVVLHGGMSDNPAEVWLLSRQNRNGKLLDGTGTDSLEGALRFLNDAVEQAFTPA